MESQNKTFDIVDSVRSVFTKLNDLERKNNDLEQENKRLKRLNDELNDEKYFLKDEKETIFGTMSDALKRDILREVIYEVNQFVFHNDNVKKDIKEKSRKKKKRSYDEFNEVTTKEKKLEYHECSEEDEKYFHHLQKNKHLIDKTKIDCKCGLVSHRQLLGDKNIEKLISVLELTFEDFLNDKKLNKMFDVGKGNHEYLRNHIFSRCINV